MLEGIKLSFLLQGLILVLLGTAHKASSLGLTVHVVPLESEGGNKVRAHFSAIAPSPCPALSGLCAEGEDCLVHKTSLPFNGTKPNPGWCVRQWQKTVPSNYNANIKLGSKTEFYVSVKADPKVRGNSGRLNQPPYVALLPPLRARVNCPHHFHLSVKDLDGDRVRCRFALADMKECVSCTQYSFIELDEEKCMFRFNGKAPAGQYFIHLMAEDRIPIPRINQFIENKPLSAVPVYLSLTVEESTSSCSEEPVATGETPLEDFTFFVLPYDQAQFSVTFVSQLERVLEVAVVGPPELYRVGFKSLGSLATMMMAWVRAENKLTHLLPICFAANTKSLQSEPRCVWLYQRKVRQLPAGTELTCEKTAMTLVLPVSSLKDINLDELQLNSPDCPVKYNSTYLTATISLADCGTKTVHSGKELIYTNTLKSVRPYEKVSRRPVLLLPLACRIPGARIMGPQYKITMPTEKEVFGEVQFWIEFYMAGEGPMSKFTRKPKFRSLRILHRRVRREAESVSESDSASTSLTDDIIYTSAIGNGTSGNSPSRLAVGSQITVLDLHLMSSCKIDRAQMIVSECEESETEDFAESRPFLQQGCAVSNDIAEILTNDSSSRIFRLDFSSAKHNGSTMYVKCTVNLCFATMPSQKCPDLCSDTINQRTLIGSVFTTSYTVVSGPVSLVVTTPAPTTTTVITTAATPAATPAPTTTTVITTAPTTATHTANTASTTVATITTTAAQSTSASHAPGQALTMAAGVILTTLSIFLQNTFLC